MNYGGLDPEDYWEELENDDPWLEDEEDDSDEDQPDLEDPDDAISDRFTWFWGEDIEEGGSD